ncbi:MAG: GNAT family N-acetyltransferase [Porphyromonadaceae bacterium]|nr:MAG: GNAT family N-acetyltransferase [Porphyromonadaceae bacterium]
MLRWIIRYINCSCLKTATGLSGGSQLLLTRWRSISGRSPSACSQGRPIGFIIALPDVNIILKNLNGRLLLFGWLKLLIGLPKLRYYRVFALAVIPEYHGKGIDSLIYRALYDSLFSKDLWMEINYVLEDNDVMNNAIVKLDAKPLRRYRIYEKGL